MNQSVAEQRPYTPAPLIEENPERRENRIPGWYRFFIGDIEATIVADGRLPPCASEEFTVVPEEALHAALRRHFLPTNALIMEQNCMVLRLGGKCVLFDCGIGIDKQIGGDETGRLIVNMAAAGIDRNDVAAVVLTHAHSDHCWGLVDEHGDLNFPNAELFLPEAEYSFWTDEGRLSAEGYKGQFTLGARRNLLPYRDRLNFVADGREVLPGVTALATPGHSIGHTCYLISSNGSNYAFIGDVAHSSVLHFEFPHLQFSYDLDALQAVESRERLFDKAATEGLSLIGYHFPFPGVGNIRREGGAYAYVPTPILHK